MRRIGILAYVERKGIGPIIQNFVQLAHDQDIELILEEPLRKVCVCSGVTFRPAAELAGHSDILVAMGGDGTILRAAKLVASSHKPILGVNLGRLGFLAGAAPEELRESLGRLKRGEYQLEERMALEARIGNNSVFALNEFVIEKAVLARLVQVKTWISDTPFSSFFGNGIIVSTPTGSTSYSLSAGGPILHPDLRAFIVTPICAHSLSLRPAVIPGNQSITVQVIAEHSDIMVTADGQIVSPIQPEEPVHIRQADHTTRLINLQGLSFYQLLRRKLDWSLDRRELQES
ncbi:MAG: NAD(+)/NADH kinase [Gemmatimonadetes bacterium]|nr:NAD(+)/NADH kinase [Gemmatimonadota bacterium]MDE3256574.1 NAD(+)/NADH kinase [Gemmatimonadota bacterium]